VSAGGPGAQRRAFHRAPVIAPVTLVPARFRVGWLEGRTRDLSASGALVSGAERLREGERLRVLLELGPDDLLDASGRVVRIEESGLAGLRLDRLAEKDRERLVRYVALRQRESLAALRNR
jgi:c-di-GMP-binding flagellar brake protein YcgR